MIKIKKYRLAIVGMGNMGQQYLRQIKEDVVIDADVVAVATRSQKESLLARYPELCIYCDTAELIEQATIDGVIITLPNHLHYTAAKAALLAGKHVLVEKPATLYLAELEELIALATEKQLKLSVMFQWRMNPLFQAVKKELDFPIQRIFWNVPFYRSQEYYSSRSWTGKWHPDGGGVLLNQAIHELDLWQYLFGFPKRMVSSVSFGEQREIEVDDQAVLLFEYPQARGTFVTSVAEPFGEEYLEVVGKDKHLKVYHNRLHAISAAGEKISEFELTNQGNKDRLNILRNFVAAIDQQEELISPGSESIYSLNLIHGAWLSTWKKAWVELPIYEAEYTEVYQNFINSLKKSGGLKND